ncbi:protein RESISTANCE TO PHYTOPHTHORA 1, chloroplastic [Oryza sativa Japonica Group]|uniref:Os05g0404400 protein n=5 Tax=Oryza TaxID=4527 RepID=Q6AUK1_ORYSJ|nr:uncharacterized protein LOC4338746 [Oryza sativa Japonica Group]XP_052155632.1 protein RESISTANCE TO PHYTOPHTHORA 1, chloroplastic [Oryza glaberrima]EEC79203.1 hypothetical protein OsI_19917 [Oryza sativa Indica Group]AAT85080.1 unknown protein [Oryza sativa Japonica Group]AAT85221.1 unknown protein [Oryza sativa Japonica Group]EEE63679.1 hypothetical protein OsJ_18497 [Oryza sativa Japonica Group]KAF2930712.1 hypothetical protein DAI22_05g156600 [Oryza sativa Japonica Group]|eukprot:NP_001055503.1 Os05g0404400 [Oryza sativa Japonica Group]
MYSPLGSGCAFAAAASSAFPPATVPGGIFAGRRRRRPARLVLAWASSDGSDGGGAAAGAVAAEASAVGESKEGEVASGGGSSAESSAEKKPAPVDPKIEKELKKAVQKTAATFAPRASTATKNPAVPGTALYTIFEVQGYASMLLGGALSFNLVFPSNEPDIWRLMGMWSIWMFTIPSLRARDCSSKEKEALNYLFLLVPLINVIIPFFVKSFAVVWSADTVAFFVMYAWKLGWLQRSE